MSAQRCEACGLMMFFNHSMNSSSGSGDGLRHTHGYNAEACDLAAEVREQMPVLYDMAIQSLVEIEQAIGRLVSGCEDEEWEDPKALQRLLLDAHHMSSEGVRVEARWREMPERAA